MVFCLLNTSSECITLKDYEILFANLVRILFIYSLPEQYWCWQRWSMLLRKWPHRQPRRPVDPVPLHVLCGWSWTFQNALIGRKRIYSCLKMLFLPPWSRLAGKKGPKPTRNKILEDPTLTTNGTLAHLDRWQGTVGGGLWTHALGLCSGRWR